MSKIRFTDQSPELVIPVGSHLSNTSTNGVRINLDDEASEKAVAFLRASELEQGGLILGRIWSHPAAPLALAQVDILEAIPSQQGTSSAYSLHMNAGVWTSALQTLNQLNQVLSPNEQALRIIGWFHSHPYLGAFFSATDMDTQRAFFRQPFNVGWVIDPHTDPGRPEHAFFLGPNCVPVSL
jgi:Prokaryotic homologs of the JAB domain